jgi:hypothetical protein
MVFEVCRRLRAFSPLTDYHYVGFGAYEFVDFELCRRELGLVTMHSIEVDSSAAARYSFNRPFADIAIHFDTASNVLPDLVDTAALRIVWLDYTSGLEQEVLQDVGICLRRLIPGSMLIVTVNATPAKPASDRRAELVRAVGATRVDPQVTNETLAHGLPSVQRDILMHEVATQLPRRTDGSTFEQVLNIRYRDSQTMHTWGGVLVAPGMRSAFDSAHFEDLEQVSTDSRLIDATVEPLTTREVLHLNRQLPVTTPNTLGGHGIPDNALRAYERLYRWYPSVPIAM